MTDITREFLDHYLSDQTPSRFAVMIEGPWGAGKTWFVKHYLAARAAARKRADPLNDVGYVYVSLYGKSSRAEIAAALFAAAHPVLAGRWVQGGVGALGRLANTLSRGQAIKATDAAALQAAVTELRGKVLVFDDVERCEMPQAELFGYLNDFVEGQGLKVLLIANEKELNKKFQEEYTTQKEKVVGKTLAIKSNSVTAYRALARQMSDDAARSAAQTNEAAALATFHASGTKNIRSLRASLDDFNRVVAVADPRLRTNLPALQSVLLYMIATTLESRAGEIKLEELGLIGAARSRAYFSRGAGREPSELEAKIVRVSSKYENIDWGEPIVPPEVVAQLYGTGALDVDAMNAAIAAHPLIVPPAETPAWRLLWRWFEAGREKYDYARQRVLDELEAGTIHHPGPILHLAGTALSLAKHGDPLVEDVVPFFRDYIDRQVLRRQLEPDMDFAESAYTSGYAGLGYSEPETSEFQAVKLHLKSAIARAFEAAMKDAAAGLLERLRSQPSTEVGLSVHSDEPSVYRRRPVLHHVEPREFAAICISDYRLNREVLGLLTARYHYAASNLQVERPWVASVRTVLEEMASEFPAPFKMQVLGDIAYWFDGMEESLATGDPQ